MAISRSDMERQLRNMGGIMSLQDPRQGYFLGKLVKKAKRAVKKVVKSPIGKAALLGAAAFGIPGTQFGGFLGKGALGRLKGKLFGTAASKAAGPFSYLQGTPFSKGLLGKLGLTKGGGSMGLTGLGKIAGIGGLTGLAGLMASGEEDEDEINFSKLDRGEGLDIDRIVRLARQNDPQFRFLPGAEFTDTYAKGGEVDAGAPEIKVKGDVRPENMKMVDKFDMDDPMYKGINPKVVKEFIEEGIPLGYETPEDYFEDFYGPIGLKEGGITSLEKDPEYKGWKKMYMMNPDAAESHPKHTEFENYLKSKENKKAEGGMSLTDKQLEIIKEGGPKIIGLLADADKMMGTEGDRLDMALQMLLRDNKDNELLKYALDTAEERGTTKLDVLMDLIRSQRISDISAFDRGKKSVVDKISVKDLARKEGSMKDGGLMSLGGMEMDLRGGGFVPIGAKEKADDVPARLSKNEFVMTADAVRAAGGGSVDKGADKMYKMMKNLEAQV